MINVINKNKYIHAAIVLMLIVCILINAAIPARAELALTTGIIAVVGTILVASGMSFDSDSSMTAAAKNFWKSIDSDTKTAIAAIADQYADFMTGNPLQKFVFKISKPVVSAVAGWLSGLGVSADSTSVPVPISSGLPFVFDTGDLPYWTATKRDEYGYYVESNPERYMKITDGLYITKASLSRVEPAVGFHVVCRSSASSNVCDYYTSIYPDIFKSKPNVSYLCRLVKTARNQLTMMLSDGTVVGVFQSDVYINYINAASASGTASIPIAPDYIPAGSGTKPLDSDCDIVLPSGLVKTGTGTDTIDSDLVGTMTPDSVRDTSTDVDVPDTGILSGIRDLVGDIAGAITGTLSDLLTGIKTGIDSIATTLGNFFDVSQFELDFSPFQIGLTKIFPFCIPFDFFNGIKLFAQQADNFSFDIKLDTDYFKIDHSVDLSHFKVPFAFFRFVAVFWFSYILISRTRDFMKW